MKRICIDMDGIVADLLTKWLRVYNDEWNDDLTIADIQTWETHDYVNPDLGRGIYQLIERAGFFDDLAPISGAIEGVTKLVEAGHEVVLATAAASGDSARAKVEWVQTHFEHLGFGRRDMFIGHKKHWLDAAGWTPTS
jgi:5'(3')-deoxyribonucleotidase